MLVVTQLVRAGCYTAGACWLLHSWSVLVVTQLVRVGCVDSVAGVSWLLIKCNWCLLDG